MVGSAHPGFTALLMGIDAVGGGLRSLALPALVAGVAGPPLLYLALRRLGYERSISVLLASALAVGQQHIMYSGRVKGYTLDPLLILLLSVIVAPLANRRWGLRTATAWVGLSWVIGSFSGFALVATAAAVAILVLHPRSDVVVRLAAAAVQGIGQLAYVLNARRFTDIDGIDQFMEDFHDAHIELQLNPVDFAGEAMRHLRRVIEVYPGGTGGWLTLAVVVWLGGLAAASLSSNRRSELLAARFLLLLVVIAFVGALAGKFPFGPTLENSVFRSAGSTSGGRYMLWIIPAVAVGMAASLQRVRSFARARTSALRAFDVVLLAAALVLVVQGYERAPAYPNPGSASATAFIESTIEPDDVLIVVGTSVYSFAVATSLPVALEATPEHQVGFTPMFGGDGRWAMGAWSPTPATPDAVREAIAGADRVIVYAPLLGPEPSARDR